MTPTPLTYLPVKTIFYFSRFSIYYVKVCLTQSHNLLQGASLFEKVFWEQSQCVSVTRDGVYVSPALGVQF